MTKLNFNNNMKIIISSLLFLATINVFGFTVKGKVTSTQDTIPISNALIIIQSSLGEVDSSFTDSLGKFNVEVSNKGAYKISAQSSLKHFPDSSTTPLYYPSKKKILNLTNSFSAVRFIHFKLKPIKTMK